MSELRLRRDKLQWLTADGEVVALDERSLLYLSANESAALLWERLAQGATREQLAETLVDAFGIDAESAGRDVDCFLAELRSRGLLDG